MKCHLWQRGLPSRPMDGKRTSSPFGHLLGQGMQFGSVGRDGLRDKNQASVSWLPLACLESSGRPVFLASSTIACRAAWVWLGRLALNCCNLANFAALLLEAADMAGNSWGRSEKVYAKVVCHNVLCMVGKKVYLHWINF